MLPWWRRGHLQDPEQRCSGEQDIVLPGHLAKLCFQAPLVQRSLRTLSRTEEPIHHGTGSKPEAGDQSSGKQIQSKTGKTSCQNQFPFISKIQIKT